MPTGDTGRATRRLQDAAICRLSRAPTWRTIRRERRSELPKLELRDTRRRSSSLFPRTRLPNLVAAFVH
jgi:hypothetical protein